MKAYLRHKSLNVMDVKELIALEYLDFEGKYKNYTEKHDFYELCYVERGEITLCLDGEMTELRRDSAVLIEPNTEHTYLSDRGNASRVFVVCFECPSNTLRLLSGVVFSLSKDQIYCMHKIISEGESTFRMNENDILELLSTPSFGGQQAIILQLEYMLIGLLRRHSAEKSSGIVFLDRENFYPDLVRIIIAYLRSNVQKNITLGDVCKSFNYSRSYICKIFKEQTGESLITYFNRLKIEESKRLLEDTEMSVTAISDLLGFSEAKYFGVAFKNRVGSSPIAYRKECREGRPVAKKP